MIEPTGEMVQAVLDNLFGYDAAPIDDAPRDAVAAILAIIERDYVVYRRSPVDPFGPSTEPCGGCGCDRKWHTDVGCTGDFTKCHCVEWVPS